jgi:hypothetical protein
MCRRSASLFAVAVAVLTATSVSSRPARASLAPPATRTETGYTYTVRATESNEPGRDRLLVEVLGDVTRIEGARRSGKGTGNDYLLVTNGGSRVVIVRPSRSTYSELTTAEFETMIGALLQKVDKVVTVKLQKANVRSDRLGAGPALLGLPTQHTRLTQDFTVGVGAFGFTKDVRQRIVTDFWVSPELPLAANPAIMLVAGAHAALAQTDPDFVSKSRRERMALCPGMPLKMVVTSYSDIEGEMTRDESVRTIEVVEAKKATIDPARMVVPKGYARDASKFGWSIDL